MKATVIDTLRFANRLKEAGVEPRQAEAMSRAINDELTEGVVTKRDLDAAVAELKNEAAKKFSAIDARFDAMDAKFEGRLDAMDAKFEGGLGAMDATPWTGSSQLCSKPCPRRSASKAATRS